MYKVNGIPIAEEDIWQEMQYHPADSQEQAMVLAIEALMIAELFKQRAQQLDIAIDENEAFVDALIDREVEYPRATAADCERYYEQNSKKFRTSPLVDVSHILLACAPDDVEGRSAANHAAGDLLSQLQQSPELFADLARAHSSCPSAETGGHLGQISCGQTVPEFERQVFNSAPGLVTSPLESRYGIHLVMIHQREEARQLPFDLVSDKISDYLNTKVRHQAVAQYIATLIDKANIEGFEFTSKQAQFHH